MLVSLIPRGDQDLDQLLREAHKPSGATTVKHGTSGPGNPSRDTVSGGSSADMGARVAFTRVERRSPCSSRVCSRPTSLGSLDSRNDPRNH